MRTREGEASKLSSNVQSRKGNGIAATMPYRNGAGVAKWLLLEGKWEYVEGYCHHESFAKS